MTELQEQIMELRKQGMTYSQIKENLNCSKGTISYYLGVGQKEKTARRQNVSRGKFRVIIQKIKQETPCTDCGESYPYWIMDFDHLEDKSFNISSMVREVGCSLEKLNTELEKCEIVCSNCHRNRTHMRSRKSDSKDMLDIHEYYARLV